MEVKYTAQSLEEIARYWDEAAKDAKARSEQRKSKIDKARDIAEAATCERVAHMLRHTTLAK